MTQPRSPRRTLLSAAPAAARTLTPAEYQNRYRHGHRACRLALRDILAAFEGELP